MLETFFENTIANYAADDCRKILDVDELIAFSQIRLYMQILVVVFQECGEQWASVVVLVWAVAGDLSPDRAEMQPVFFADTKLPDEIEKCRRLETVLFLLHLLEKNTVKFNFSPCFYCNLI